MNKRQGLGASATLLLCALVSGCATQDALVVPPAPPKVVEAPQVRLPAPPAGVMQERPADFRQRLLNFFSERPNAPTK